MDKQPIWSTMAHVFQIDPVTRKSWIPSFGEAVPVVLYSSLTPARKIYRVIAVANAKELVNSIITAKMTFRTTSSVFGQWSDYSFNTVYGLGFATNNDLIQFSNKFSEAKNALTQSAAPSTAGAEALTAKKPLSLSLFSPPPNASNSIETLLSIYSGNSNGSNNPDIGLVNGETDVEEPSTSSIIQLKYENDMLKIALDRSNAKVQVFKKKYARVTEALQKNRNDMKRWKQHLILCTIELKKKVDELYDELHNRKTLMSITSFTMDL